jgi:hypothetical protein
MNRIGKQTDWKNLQGLIYSTARPKTVQEGKYRISEAVNNLLEMSGVRPRFFWSNKLDFFLGSRRYGSDLPAVLAARILTWVSNSQRTMVCSNCGRPFPQRKGQNPTLNCYCNLPGCKSAARNAAERRYTQREKSQPQRAKRRRLTPGQVRAIRQRVNTLRSKNETVSMKHWRQLAERYGVSDSTVRKVANRKTWEEVR